MSNNKSIFNRSTRFDHKYYTRLLIVFIIMIIAFMVIIAVTTYISNYKTIERSFQAKNTDLFSIHARNLQYNMDLILNINNQLITDDNLLKYISLKDGIESNSQLMMADFIKSLYNRVYSLNIIQYMGVYLTDDDKIIHDKGAESGRDFFNGFAFEGLNNKQLYDFLNQKQRYDIKTFKTKSTGSVDMICIIRNSLVNYSKMSIITYLNPQILATKNSDESGTTFVYDESAGFLASTGGHEVITPDVLLKVKSQQSGSLKFEKDGKGYYLYFGYYKPLHWYYGYLANMTPMQSQISKYTLWTGVLIALLVVFGIFLAFVLTGVAYKPVRRILSRMQIEKMSDEKEKLDEFELISQNFFEVKQNNTILHKKLEHSKPMLKSGFLKDLLYGTPTEKIDDEIESALDIHFDKETFQVLILDIDDFVMMEHNNTEEVNTLLKQDVLSTSEFYFKKIYPCEVLESGFGKIAVILNFDYENDGLAVAVREIQELLRKELSINVTVSIGSKYKSIKDISLSFKEAMQVMEYKYALGRGKILSMADIEAFSNDTFYYPLDRERFIINATVTGDFNIVKNAIYEIIDDNFTKRSLKSEVRYHLLSAMAGTLIRIFHTINMTPEDIFGKDYDIYNEMRDFDDLYLFRNKLVNIYHALCDKIIETQDKTEDKTKNKMIACIENNYHRYDFSLNDMAGQFNLSSTYFSDLFKERIGENFIDYLIQYRLNKAKELMSGTNLKINEIAGKVGYNNTTSFIRVFKKYEGVSPGKFKEITY